MSMLILFEMQVTLLLLIKVWKEKSLDILVATMQKQKENEAKSNKSMVRINFEKTISRLIQKAEVGEGGEMRDFYFELRIEEERQQLDQYNLVGLLSIIVGLGSKTCVLWYNKGCLQRRGRDFYQ